MHHVCTATPAGALTPGHGPDRITQPEPKTFMATLLQEAKPTDTTNCCAAAILWDNAKAAKSRKMCEYETDQECICPEGGNCWLV